jgi:hypothetical protein
VSLLYVGRVAISSSALGFVASSVHRACNPSCVSPLMLSSQLGLPPWVKMMVGRDGGYWVSVPPSIPSRVAFFQFLILFLFLLCQACMCLVIIPECAGGQVS